MAARELGFLHPRSPGPWPGWPSQQSGCQLVARPCCWEGTPEPSLSTQQKGPVSGRRQSGARPPASFGSNRARAACVWSAGPGWLWGRLALATASASAP